MQGFDSSFMAFVRGLFRTFSQRLLGITADKYPRGLPDEAARLKFVPIAIRFDCNSLVCNSIMPVKLQMNALYMYIYTYI